MTYDAFISYRRAGSASQARLIKSELTNRQYHVFLDVADLDKGHFDEKLLTTIAETPNFILVLAPGSLDNCVRENDWLRREVRQALATNRNIVPVCLPGFSFQPTLPADIADVNRHQAVEYSHTLFDATMEKILKAIGEPRAASSRARVRQVVAGVAVAALLAAGGYLATRKPVPPPPHAEPPRAAEFTATVIPAVEPEKGSITRAGQTPPTPGGATTTQTTGTTETAEPGAPDPTLYGLEYQYRRTPDGFAVDYRLPYLDLLRAGGPIKGIRYKTSPFLATSPPVHATIANNSAQQILVTSVVLDITRSDPRREVVLTVDDDSTNTLVWVNHGWADVEDARLVFSIRGAAPKEVTLGTFSASKVVPIVKYLPPELAEAESANVSGTMEYGLAGQRHTVKFATTVKLRTIPGAPLPPAEAYDLFFPAGETGRIVVDLPAAHQIKPGEAEALELRIGTDRSCSTSMKVSFLTDAGKEIPANTLTLDLFVPRFTGMQTRQRANPKNN